MAQRRHSFRLLLGVWPWFPLAAALCTGTTACGVELDSPAEVDSLRILGVRKSVPYAEPGESVEMSMLWHDGTRSEDDVPRPEVPIHRVWIGGCVNPYGDFYYTCAPQVLLTLAAVRAVQLGLSEAELYEIAAGLSTITSESELVAALRALPFDFEGELPTAPLDAPLPFGQFAVGDRFTLPIPADVITRSPENRPPYGVVYPFFAACAGTISVSLDVLNQTVPIVCKDQDGALLASDDFVVGYSSVYAYEELRNENPLIRGLQVNGFPSEPPEDSPFVCFNEDCLVPDEPLGEGEVCTRHLECASENCERTDTGRACAPPVSPECDVNVPCIDPCQDDGDREKCDEITVRPVLEDALPNAEQDPLSSIGGEEFEEQMWVNYHADRGSFGSVVKLVNDSVKGWNSEFDTDLYAPKFVEPPEDPAGDRMRMHIWAVVRDNRGGASWVRQTVFVRRTPGD